MVKAEPQFWQAHMCHEAIQPYFHFLFPLAQRLILDREFYGFLLVKEINILFICIYFNYYMVMDTVDRKLIGILSEDAKRSLADMGASVGLSASSVNERIRRLTESGVIRRFTVELDPVAIGLPTLVFVWVALRENADEAAFRRYAATHPMILECHHVTGGWSYLIKIRVGSTREIETFLEELKAHQFLGRSETVIALSSPVAGSFVCKDMR